MATVIDCRSRRLVGWSIAEHMRTALVEDALKAAALVRGSRNGAVFHADHRSQYTSKDFAGLCEQLGVTRWIGAIGSSVGRSTPLSNARHYRGATRWGSPRAARLVVFRWITRYNTKQRHSHGNYLSPTSYENAHTTDGLDHVA